MNNPASSKQLAQRMKDHIADMQLFIDNLRQVAQKPGFDPTPRQEADPQLTPSRTQREQRLSK